MSTQSVTETPHTRPRLPVAALTLMALTGFIVIMTETLPAGLLPLLSTAFDVTEGAAGQLVSAYALGTVLAAIPAIAATQRLPRKRLLVIGLLGFFVANSLTAFAPTYAVALAARFIGGAFSGLLWGMLAGYARRIVAPELAGRALAIAMTGTPVALSIGTPLGTALGAAVGWRWTFIAVSILTLLTAIAVLAVVPGAPGVHTQGRTRFFRVLTIPGVAAILAVVFVWMLAHNLLYTYIAPFLQSNQVPLRPDVALFVFGAAALIGIWITGILIDKALRQLTIFSTAAFLAAALALSLLPLSLPLVIAAVVLWGIAFGGSATQLQTASALVAGQSADLANAILTTVFNLAIFSAGAAGAVLLDVSGAGALPVAMAVLSVAATCGVLLARTHAFPRTKR